MPTQEDILNALRDVQDPELHRSIVDLNMVRAVHIDGSTVRVDIALTVKGCPLTARIEGDVRGRLLEVPGVEQVVVKLDTMSDDERRALVEKLQGKREAKSRLLDPDSPTVVLAVASGKGGVGKSTVSANLACALRLEGYEVGLLDADIYGFSIPQLLGVRGQPVVLEKAIVPVPAEGLQVMSMGFFVDDRTPVAWRGPMLAGALDQFLHDVLWGDLDFLVVDLPPGTGDVPMSLAQRLPRAQQVLVTTPQPASYEVAKRAALMARRMNQAVVGVVENMAYFKCSCCGAEEELFGRGGGERLSREFGVPLLGRVPLERAVREAGDEGRPVVVARPESTAARAFREIARAVAARVRAEAAAPRGV